MQLTSVVNLKHEEYDVYIGRPGKGLSSDFGNPFPVPMYTIFRSLQLYEQYTRAKLVSDPTFKAKLMDLKGKRLGCFCKPNICHGDVLVKIIDELS